MAGGRAGRWGLWQGAGQGGGAYGRGQGREVGLIAGQGGGQLMSPMLDLFLILSRNLPSAR